MMGLSKSMVSVMGENGRPDWSMKMVDGGDVSCRSSELLSWFVVSSALFCLENFWRFMGFGHRLRSLCDLFLFFIFFSYNV